MRYALITAALFLAACQPVSTKTAEMGTCEASGGQPTQGLAGPACAMPTPDGGKSCTSSDQCSTNLCIAEDGRGHCAPYSPMFGCHDLFEDGAMIGTICID